MPYYPIPYTYVAGAVVASLAVSGWGQEAIQGGTISGPAPLAVFCDATGTTQNDGDDPWRELGYHWDFGYATPSTPGTWTYSGANKGNEVGGRGVAAHVYHTPGTYTLSLRVQGATGAKSDRSITVEVIDPDTYWTTGGRSTVTLTATTGAWPTWASNTRYVLTGGADYTARGGIAVNGNVNTICITTDDGTRATVASFGVSTNAGTTAINAYTAFPEKITLAHLADATTTTGTAVSCRSVLYSDCEFTRAYTHAGVVSFYTGSADPDTQALLYWPYDVVYENCTFGNAGGATSGNSLAANFVRSALLGCETQNTPEHGIRIFRSYKAFVAHNWFHDTAATKHHIKAQSTGLSLPTFVEGEYKSQGNTGFASRYLLIAKNKLGDSDGTTQVDWAVSIGPENDTSSQAIYDVLVEANEFTPFVGSVDVQSRGAVRLTARSNSYDNSPGESVYLSGTMAAQYYGPYYMTNLTPDGVQVFAAPAVISPSKAGT